MRTLENCWDYILAGSDGSGTELMPEERQLMAREAQQRARLRLKAYPLPEMWENYVSLALDFSAWVAMDEELLSDVNHQANLNWLRGQA